MINCRVIDFLSIFTYNRHSNLILALILESKGPYYYGKSAKVRFTALALCQSEVEDHYWWRRILHGSFLGEWEAHVPYRQISLFLHCSNGNMQQSISISLSSPTINSSRSGPLTSSSDYSDMSPHAELTSPDSAVSLYQRRPQFPPAREDAISHYTPGGPISQGRTMNRVDLADIPCTYR